MDQAAITKYVTDTFAGVNVVVGSREAGSPELAWGDTFFIYDPDRSLPPAGQFPFATMVTKDYGDFDRAVEIASAGLADWPDHPLIHYQLACFHARAGRLDDARRSLDIAFAGDERTRAWAAEDDDLAALRDA